MARLAAGSLTNVSIVALSAATFTSGGGYSMTPLYLGISLTKLMNLTEFGLQLADQNATMVGPCIQLDYTVGKPIDITIEIMGWIADTGSIWSGEIAGPYGYRGQIIWDSNGGPTTFTVPSWATTYCDVSGTSHAITDGTVTLTNLPILLEN